MNSISWLNAHAGSGKTTFLINQIIKFLENNPKPEQILCLTFSKTAAEEINKRVKQLDDNFPPIAYTLHSFCFKLLLEHNPHYQMLTTHFQEQLWTQSLNTILLKFQSEHHLSQDIINNLHLLDQTLNNDKTYKGLLGKIHSDTKEEFIKHKQKECLLDFHDILEQTLHIMNNATAGQIIYKFLSQINFLLIDEAQDLSNLQWKIIFQIMQEITQNSQFQACIAGDNKQSIYSFQGACLDSYTQAKQACEQLCKQLSYSFKEINLEKTYRCPKILCEYIDKIFPNNKHISNNDNVGSVTFLPLKPNHNQTILKIIQEKNKTIAYHDMVILVRKRHEKYAKLAQFLTNNNINVEYQNWQHIHQTIIIMLQYIHNPNLLNLEHLVHHMNPRAYYQHHGTHQSTTEYLQALNIIHCFSIDFNLSILFNTLSHHTHNPLKLLQIIFDKLHITYTHYVNDVLLQFTYYSSHSPINLYECILFLQQYHPNVKTTALNTLKIDTIHNFKGQEKQVVFLYDTTLNPNLSPLDTLYNEQYLLLNTDEEYDIYKSLKRQANLEEHKRLLYVGLTRSKGDLVIVNESDKKTISDDSWYAMISPFFE